MSERNYEVKQREAAKILPKLAQKLAGSGSLHLDTDVLSLADPVDRHHLGHLSNIIAGFVLDEADIWEAQVQELVVAVNEKSQRVARLDYLLEKLREAATAEIVDVDILKSLIAEYQTPIEEHYAKRRAERALLNQITETGE